MSDSSHSNSKHSHQAHRDTPDVFFEDLKRLKIEGGKFDLAQDHVIYSPREDPTLAGEELQEGTSRRKVMFNRCEDMVIGDGTFTMGKVIYRSEATVREDRVLSSTSSVPHAPSSLKDKLAAKGRNSGS